MQGVAQSDIANDTTSLVAKWKPIQSLQLSLGSDWWNWGDAPREYNVTITNPNPFAVTVEYNLRSAYEDDARDWTDLKHTTSITLDAGGSKTVVIRNAVAGAHFATASFVHTFGSATKRYTTALDGLWL
jgi:hypothetical protein